MKKAFKLLLMIPASPLILTGFVGWFIWHGLKAGYYFANDLWKN